MKTVIRVGWRPLQPCSGSRLLRQKEQGSDSEGPFDYIICHGVYSWVTPDIHAFDAIVLTLLDGSRDRPALASQMARHVVASPEPLAQRVDAALAVLAEAALLRA
jgi:hypothetical protein